ncbi:uncharacterized protein LOC121389913 isoform X1 [Gigantopelta aegis]|uniref:uncharacterized protein LOC121389913 isoform X1 n=1 Tax=Gigantopelta aegis TaxID=1735272 RepID=UPI001B889665|nr:uncharacterized protein LOC121389913 isoform X1 [Gigantopelta aegis]
MRPILVLFCLLLALGLTAALRCKNVERIYIKHGIRQCLCKQGYFGYHCEKTCNTAFAVDKARRWTRLCCVKQVRDICKRSCALCSGPTCKDLKKSLCTKVIKWSAERAKRTLCAKWTRSCWKECR